MDGCDAWAPYLRPTSQALDPAPPETCQLGAQGPRQVWRKLRRRPSRGLQRCSLGYHAHACMNEPTSGRYAENVAGACTVCV
jgi:hypothetical protein